MLLVVDAIVMVAPRADAGCNLIPGTVKTFNAVVGATNRPYAAPGETLEIRRRPCDGGSSGFLPNGADHVVTLVFKAPDGTNRVVALATDCAGLDTATCAGAAGVTSAVCRTEPKLATRTDIDIGDVRIVFPFPDTDADFGAPDDDRTLTGPVVIAVTPKTDPLPCQLASQTCATQTGLLACIDRFYANDGACGTTVPHDRFPHFTALPVPNYAAGCFQESPPCTAVATEVRAALDIDGNLLMPFVWRGILTADQGIPVPRLIRFRAKSPLPFQVPAQIFLASFTPEGGRLPPILEPQLDPTVVDPGVFTAFGSIDAPATTIRWSIFAFAMLGQGNKAGELFDILNPIHHSDTPEALVRYEVEPYVACSDVYSVAPHIGRGGWTWHTGSAGWLYRAGIEAVLGLQVRSDHLLIDPCIPEAWAGYDIAFRHRGGESRSRSTRSWSRIRTASATASPRRRSTVRRSP